MSWSLQNFEIFSLLHEKRGGNGYNSGQSNLLEPHSVVCYMILPSSFFLSVWLYVIKIGVILVSNFWRKNDLNMRLWVSFFKKNTSVSVWAGKENISHQNSQNFFCLFNVYPISLNKAILHLGSFVRWLITAEFKTGYYLLISLWRLFIQWWVRRDHSIW